MLKKVVVFMVAVAALFLWSCKDQTPDLPPKFTTPPEPSVHLIDNYFYAQFTWGKQGDTHTYEVLDDSLTWMDSNFVNVVEDLRNKPIYDTTGASVDVIEPPFPKKGWHYAPATSLITKQLYDYLNAESGEEPSNEELKDATRDIFTISFPWKTNDTLAFWDIQDYLDNPSIYKGQIKWGRIGNDKVSDTIWNNDAREGVVISYIDTAGVEWRTDFHPTFQPFGYFVLKTVEANVRDGQSYDIISGEFAARFYNKSKNYKDMRFGKFRMRILSDIKLGPEPK